MTGPASAQQVAAAARVRLHALAHARAGDKGNHSNIAVFACEPRFYPLLEAGLTEARVAEVFAFRRPTRVRRYLLPTLHGMNFVLEDVLDGGVNESLNLDMHGKALSYLLLAAEIDVPRGFTLPGWPGVDATPRVPAGGSSVTGRSTSPSTPGR